MTDIIESAWQSADEEKAFSADGKNTYNTTWFYTGYDDVDLAATYLFSVMPMTVTDPATLGSLTLDKFGPFKRLGYGSFGCDLSYKNDSSSDGDKASPPRVDGEFKIEWDVGTATQKVTFSEVGSYTFKVDPAYVNPNPHGAINAKKKDGKIEVEGIDVRVPAMKFSILYRAPIGLITQAYAQILRDNNLKRNNATFLGWQPLEVLFVGSSASQAVKGSPEIKFEFELDVEVKKKYGAVPLVTKPPHDYIDIWYDTTPDPASKRVVSKPIAVYVHNFYGSMSFPTILGFGGPVAPPPKKENIFPLPP